MHVEPCLDSAGERYAALGLRLSEAAASPGSVDSSPRSCASPTTGRRRVRASSKSANLAAHQQLVNDAFGHSVDSAAACSRSTHSVLLSAASTMADQAEPADQLALDACERPEELDTKSTASRSSGEPGHSSLANTISLDFLDDLACVMADALSMDRDDEEAANKHVPLQNQLLALHAPGHPLRVDSGVAGLRRARRGLGMAARRPTVSAPQLLLPGDAPRSACPPRAARFALYTNTRSFSTDLSLDAVLEGAENASRSPSPAAPRRRADGIDAIDDNACGGVDVPSSESSTADVMRTWSSGQPQAIGRSDITDWLSSARMASDGCGVAPSPPRMGQQLSALSYPFFRPACASLDSVLMSALHSSHASGSHRSSPANTLCPTLVNASVVSALRRSRSGPGNPPARAKLGTRFASKPGRGQ